MNALSKQLDDRRGALQPAVVASSGGESWFRAAGFCPAASIAAALFSLQRRFPGFVSQGSGPGGLYSSASIAAAFLSMQLHVEVVGSFALENTGERDSWAPCPWKHEHPHLITIVSVVVVIVVISVARSAEAL